MDVLATLEATRILRTAQDGGFFDDLLVPGAVKAISEALAAERARQLLAGKWDAEVEVKIREYFDKKVGAKAFRLFFILR